MLCRWRVEFGSSLEKNLGAFGNKLIAPPTPPGHRATPHVAAFPHATQLAHPGPGGPPFWAVGKQQQCCWCLLLLFLIVSWWIHGSNWLKDVKRAPAKRNCTEIPNSILWGSLCRKLLTSWGIQESRWSHLQVGLLVSSWFAVLCSALYWVFYGFFQSESNRHFGQLIPLPGIGRKPAPVLVSLPLVLHDMAK
jgi:hypothetical protein